MHNLKVKKYILMYESVSFFSVNDQQLPTISYAGTRGVVVVDPSRVLSTNHKTDMQEV